MANYNQRTPEEIRLTNFHIDKWDKILYSTQPIDRSKAEAAVINAYHHIGMSPPEIYFLTSPSRSQCLALSSIMPDDIGWFLALKQRLERQMIEDWGKEIPYIFPIPNYVNGIFIVKNSNLDDDLHLFDYYTRGEKFSELCSIVYSPDLGNINCKYNMNFHKICDNEYVRTNSWFYDFYVKHKNKDVDLKYWNVIKSLSEECQYLITWDRVCIVIERPIELYLDRELWLHSDGKAAVKYADGYELYCHHGSVVPAKYGKIHSSNWQTKWILSEEENPTSRHWHEQKELSINLFLGIGYKKYLRELPKSIEKYTSFESPGIINHALQDIIIEWLRFHYYEYYNGGNDIEWEAYTDHYLSKSPSQRLCDDIKHICKYFSCKLSKELESFYLTYQGNYPIAPGLHFYPLQEAVKNTRLDLSVYPVRLFRGDRNETYYLLCNSRRKTISPVYCQFLGRKPVVYAECLTSWIATIAQCYQEGAYYIAIDSESGERKIEQDLDKVELIFEKFNPNQIDAWRSIWKEA